VIEMAVVKKWFWESSTIWINLAGLVALVIDFFARSGKIEDAEIIAILLALANILRRFQAPKVIQPIKLI
jgi:hypothetical protein